MAATYPSTFEEVKDVKIGWGKKPALILVDVCTAYWNDNSRLSLNHNPAGKNSPESMKKVVAAARKNNIPVIWTTVYFGHKKLYDGGVEIIKSPGMDIWQEGDTRGFDQWVEGLVPEPQDMIIRKQYPSAFLGTPLNAVLRTLGADTTVVCGVSTSGCCRATAVDSTGFGYNTMFIDQSSGDRSVAIQDYTLFDLQSRYADVVSDEETIAQFTKGWTN